MTANVDTPKWGPPYTSFKTLLHLIERLEREGLPPQIDRSFLGGSEGGKTQLLSALKSLGLIQPDGRVMLVLIDLANNPEARKAGIRAVLERYYTRPLELAALNATQKQLEDAFDAYQATGDTRRKAIAFFIHAAKYAGLPLSRFFRAPGGSSIGTVRVTRRRSSAAESEEENEPSPEHEALPSLDELKQQYIAMLMKKAEADMDDKLLDRIEGLLGYRSEDDG